MATECFVSLPFGSEDGPVTCTATCAGGMEDESRAGDESGPSSPQRARKAVFYSQRLRARLIHVCSFASAFPACTSLAVRSDKGMSGSMFVPRSSPDG